MNKLFGTDGIRGKVNELPMTMEIVQSLGLAASTLFSENPASSKLAVIGKDTRPSGDLFEAALSAGLTAGGYKVIQLGILPTPAVAYFTKKLLADVGFVISASHNPPQDNGVKLFSPDGCKFSEDVEAQLESYILNKSWNNVILPLNGKITQKINANQEYAEYIKNTIPGTYFSNTPVVLDCANGAASTVAHHVFINYAELLTYINDQTSDGHRINHNCGATSPQALRQTVLEKGAGVGLAFDGDADRVILCDDQGEILTGDHILAIWGRYLIEKGQLRHNTIVATQYSNMGLDDSIRQCGGNVVRVLNGDRYVYERMVKDDLTLGGEASGHIIYRDQSSTGDGLLAGAHMIQIMQETGKSLSQLKQCISLYPQITRNVAVTEKKDLQSIPSVMQAIDQANQELGDKGRTLIRYSGTENKARIMIEGKDKQQIEKLADHIAKEIQAKIGSE